MSVYVCARVRVYVCVCVCVKERESFDIIANQKLKTCPVFYK